MISNNFEKRHIGPNEIEKEKMLKKIGFDSFEDMVDKIIPNDIRLKHSLNLPEGLNEFEYANHIKNLASKNKLYKTYIGMGYYNTITPGVIQRNILENPGWYTAYTPYQAEISQGRLEALMNFQTMVSDLTGFPLANSSLLDEATAAAEAMLMLFSGRSRSQVKAGSNKFFVSNGVFPQIKDVLKSRALHKQIELVFGKHEEIEFNESFFGAIVQYPSQGGRTHDYKAFVKTAHLAEVSVVVAADLLSLTLLKPPAEWDADVAVGSTQRFGIPMGYGGPHAAYFATSEKYKRLMPGRIIGYSKDKQGRNALRMALQTREQHIKRERATSNICTAQALLASMAGMYAVYHGPAGLKEIATDIHSLTGALATALKKIGYEIKQWQFFDTIEVALPQGVTQDQLKLISEQNAVNFRYFDNETIGISIDETTSELDIKNIISIFYTAMGDEKSIDQILLEKDIPSQIPENLRRTSKFLSHPIFNKYHSETDMMRYIKKLEIKDLSLNRSMIPLGSCTMKLNAATSLFALSWPEFGSLHPFVPKDQAMGYIEMINELEKGLCEITGFSAVSFQPNSGASGEYAGLLTIKAYQADKGEGHRNICLIPASAHGTNPASSVMAGFKVVQIKTDEKGNIDVVDLKEKASLHKELLACIMITYPSTHGVYETAIREIIDYVHECGGQVYMDGANMNAQVGLTNPAFIGADVCHLNLHKTFGIPHGGGGPGVGPIGVAEHLKPYLPKHPVIEIGGEKGINALAAAPFGSSFILTISYAYLKLLGKTGLVNATYWAMLNANYLKESLKNDYSILYTGENNLVAHEFILDCNIFSKTADITVVDIAKRLMDYGFHAPTVAFPVHGTLMVEPTESEPLSELDRFVEAMCSIRKEIAAIESGKVDKINNVIKNAPHTVEQLMADEWKYPYSRELAAFPVAMDRNAKYWAPVARIDDAYGDRNLMCSCLPIEEEYEVE